MQSIFRTRNRPLVEHGAAAVPRLGGHLPDIRLPGGERGADDDALEEGGRREGAPAADGVHADSVPARQQVPLRRSRHGQPLKGRSVLRTQQYPTELSCVRAALLTHN